MDTLFSRGGLNRLQVLVEVASRQPNVRQRDVARALGITPQAVNEYFHELTGQGLVEPGRQGGWRITPEGTDYVMQQARELWRYSVKVLENVVGKVEVWPAVAGADLRAGQRVCMVVEGGMAVARPAGPGEADASGEAAGDADEGQDVGIVALQGIIPMDAGEVSVVQVPSIRLGGSRSCDLAVLAASLSGLVVSDGVEALVCCRRAGREPEARFAPLEVVVAAARLGLRCTLVTTEERAHQALHELHEAGIANRLIDACAP